MSRLERLRRFSYQYEIMRLLFVFLGGTISIFILQYAVLEILNISTQINQDQASIFLPQTQLLKNPQNSTAQQKVTQLQQKINFEYGTIIFLLFLIYVIPIILSIVFTKISSERRIVPPSYMQIIIFGYALIYLSFHKEYANIAIGVAFALGYFCLFAGLTQNFFVRRLVGIKVGETEINKFSLKTNSKAEDIEIVLLKEKYRKELGLKNDIEETRRGIIIRSLPKKNPQVVIELERGDNDNETFVNVAIFEKGNYEFRRTPRLEEQSTIFMLYLKNVLSRIENGIEFMDISDLHADPLVAQIVEENKGITPYVEGINMMGIFKIIMFIGGVVSVGYLFSIERSIEATSILFFLFMYLAFELRSTIFRRFRKSQV